MKSLASDMGFLGIERCFPQLDFLFQKIREVNIVFDELDILNPTSKIILLLMENNFTCGCAYTNRYYTILRIVI